MNLLSCLLPGPDVVRLETWSFEPASSTVTLILTSRSRPARCPLCRQRARRTHSWYERTLADLPWSENAVLVRLRVRRLFCDTASCERRVFTERLPGLAAPWARKTTRLADRLTAIGLALGGAAGARLARKLGLTASRNTLLHLIRQAPMPPIVTPSALGVDDWALRKRYTYGTVLVDLERHRPVALLPNREADTLAAWLREHPGVAVIARDRSGAYAEGASRGAPEAVQVADRFHLLQNLAETLELVFTTHARDLREVEQSRDRAVAAVGGPVRIASLARPNRALALAAERRARRLARHEQVWVLHRQGWPGEKIARHLGVGRATVFRTLRTVAFPERKGRSDAGHSLLDPWREVVLEHWTAGCRDGYRLFLELQRRGFRGSYQTVVRYLRRLREAHGAVQSYRPRQRSGLALAAAPRRRVLTPRTAAWMVLRRSEKRGMEEQALLDELRRRVPELDQTVALAEAFTGLVRDRAPEHLDPWLQQAQDGAIPALRRFAKRLSADYDAVRAAVMLDWSNGPAEGQINRLKALKRAMYGRADLDLLERRFLLAA